jgi:hypothetical protein
MRNRPLSMILVLIAAAPAWAGVEMTMETTDPAGTLAYTTTFRSQGDYVRMDNLTAAGEADVSTIFLGDRFIVLEHAERRYAVVDRAMLDEVAAQLKVAIEQMEEDIARLPQEQQAEAKRELQRQVSDLMGTRPTAERRVKDTGAGEWNGEPCRRYAVYEGANLTQEICAADLDHIDGAKQALDAFRTMADYLAKMTESFPTAAVGPNPGELLDQIVGFPVITREYRMGRVVQTMTLTAADEADVDENVFEVPEGYAVYDVMSEPPQSSLE